MNSSRGKWKSLSSRPARDYRVPISTTAAQLLDAIVPILYPRLLRGLDTDHLDDFLDRNRAPLEIVIEQNLGPLLSRMQAANHPFATDQDIPELWTASKRAAAQRRDGSRPGALGGHRALPTNL